MRIAFHTPLNAFDDGRISGDRRMAQQLATALTRLGHSIEPILDARSYMPTPDAAALEAMQRHASVRCETLLAGWRQSGAAPELWFTYHSYYKAPDLIGPRIAAALGIPCIVAEASDAARRMTGEWAAHAGLARAGFAEADLHLCFTARDREGIARIDPHAAMLDLPPFIAVPARSPRPKTGAGGPLRLVTVAMMRPGHKYESHLALATALADLVDLDWNLTLIGDGPMRAEVEAAFAGLPTARLQWRGALGHDAVAAELAAHDVFVWPGIGEAYGLVYLEAQAAGLPVVAFASGGVPETVRPGKTALLVPERDGPALAAALRQIMTEPALRRRMGAAAHRFVTRERSLDSACAILEHGLRLACEGRARRLAEAGA